MLRSMTGYGRGECTKYNRKVVVEIKSVNHRYSDITIKAPHAIYSYEDKLRKKLSAEIQRGKIDLYIGLDSFAEDNVKISVNDGLADAYVSALTHISNRYNLKSDLNPELIAKLPEVIIVNKDTNNEQALEEIWGALETALDSAVVAFISMRESEGFALKRDLLEKLCIINGYAHEIKKMEPQIALEYRQKIKQRMSVLLENVNIDENRLLAEAALLAERSCVDEEITRLFSHFEQMKEILTQGGAIGRKLDFLVQEMNREVNTIGSKSGDISVTKIVVELKSEIEKIREQVQNIE